VNILYLSTGVFDQQYGQQRYELNFLHSCFIEEPHLNFRIILLNDYKIPDARKLRIPRFRFVLCGKKWRFMSKVNFVLSSFWYTLIDRPSFIVCGHINLSFVCLIICRIFKLKYALFTHGTDVWYIKSKFKLKALMCAHRIISVSHYTASNIKRQIPQRLKEIIILPNSVDILKFAPGEKPKSLITKYNLDGYKVILTIARLDFVDQAKGYDKVIAALPKVMEKIPKVKYVLAGDGNDISRVKRSVVNLGLNDHVIFTGFISDEELSAYYNLCDVFVMPSKQEGFGIVFLEALACGKPVIAGNRDGSKEALLDGKLGVLVDPDNINEIAEAIINILLKNAPTQFLNADYLRDMVINNFGFEKFSKKVKELFENYFLCDGYFAYR
jgi:glycosyltransferase involved in cell wall biosynthesis